MKNRLIGLMVTILLLTVFNGCKKSGGSDTNANNTFTINGKTYSVTKIVYSSAYTDLEATDPTGTAYGIEVDFNAKPTPSTSGNFTVIDEENDNFTNNSQVAITIVTGTATSQSYYSQRGDNAVVTVGSNGKINVNFTNVHFKSATNQLVMASANITEQ